MNMLFSKSLIKKPCCKTLVWSNFFVAHRADSFEAGLTARVAVLFQPVSSVNCGRVHSHRYTCKEHLNPVHTQKPHAHDSRTLRQTRDFRHVGLPPFKAPTPSAKRIIDPNTPPVEMNCSWDGRARIVIHQPFYNTGYPNQPYYR